MEEKECVDKLKKAMDDIHKNAKMLGDDKHTREAIKGIQEACKVLKQIREEV